VFRKLGIEVLMMYDRVDEWVVSALTEFDGKPLQSVARGDLDLGKLGDGTAKEEQEKREYKDLLEHMQSVLKERASGVRVTDRLTDSPACLVSDEHGMSMNLERLLKASGQKVPAIKPVLEINPRHPIVERLKDESDSSRFSDWSHILFDQATLAEGGQLDDPATFVKRLNELMLALAGGPRSRIWTPGA
jgi:molecular chaperone HtpG